MERRLGLACFCVALALGPLGLACSMDGTPAPPDPIAPAACGSPTELAPTLWDIAQGQEASTFGALLTKLQQPYGPDQREPINELMRAVVAILRDYARDPAEDGGAPCSSSVPTRGAYHHRTCMVQRLLDPERTSDGERPLQLAAVDAIADLRPLLTDVLDYTLGINDFAAPAYDEDGDGDPSHPALIALIGKTCSQDAVCGVDRTLTLVVGLVDYVARPTHAGATGGCLDPATVGERLFCAAEAFVLDPQFPEWWGYLDFSNPDPNERGQPKGRSGFLALAQFLLDAIAIAEDDPQLAHDQVLAQLEQLLRQTLTTAWNGTPLLAAWDRLTGEVDLMLLPENGVIVPLQAALACLESADRRARAAEEERTGRALPEGQILLVTAHSLLFADPAAPALTLQGLVRDLKILFTLDPDGVVTAVVSDVVHALYAHVELFSESTAALPAACKLIFDAETAGELLPLLRELVDRPLVEETICVLDVLLYGCAGGEPPTICALGGAGEGE